MTVTFDRAFSQVMAGCAEPRDDEPGTWITDDMLEAYGVLAKRGLAHSVETWSDGRLAGGLYGVAIGRMFYGESMFSRQSDASKVALVALTRQLERWGFAMIDCQMSTRTPGLPRRARRPAGGVSRTDARPGPEARRPRAVDVRPGPVK